MPLFNKRILTQNLTICEIPADHLQILQDWQGMISNRNLEKHKEPAVVASALGFAAVNGASSCISRTILDRASDTDVPR